MPTCARPLASARLAADWVGYDSTVSAFLPALVHFAFCAVASSSSVVPASTDTVRPQMLLRFVIFGPPTAFSKNDVPALK